MRILVVAPQPFFSPRGTPFSVYYRTLITSELGETIDFLTYGQGQDVEIPNVRFLRIPGFKWIGNVKIGPSIFKLFLDLFIIVRMLTLCTRNRYDVVHAHEESVFVAAFLKPLFKFKLIYDMHSSLPQQLSNFKFTTSKLIISIFKRLEDYSLKKADAIITICPALFDYVDSVIEHKERHFLIENSIFDPVRLKSEPNKDEATEPESSTFEKLAEKGITLPATEKLLVYAGTLEEYQGIDILLKSIPIVEKNGEKVFLLVVGGTPEQVEFYQTMAQEIGLTEQQVAFTGRLPQVDARRCSDRADLLLSPRSAGTNTPLKIYEQIASGIPLIATAIYSHTQVLDDKVAFLAQPNPEDFGAQIVKALNNPEAATEIAKNARQLYDQKYSRSVYKSKMTQLFNCLR